MNNAWFRRLNPQKLAGKSADGDFPHRASPLVSPKPAENHRLPPPFKIKSLSPSGSGSLHFSTLRNRARPSPVRCCLRFFSFRDVESGGHRQQAETGHEMMSAFAISASKNVFSPTVNPELFDSAMRLKHLHDLITMPLLGPIQWRAALIVTRIYFGSIGKQ